MDRTVKLWLNTLLFIMLVLILSFTVIYNLENHNGLMILASLLIISVSFRYLLFYESERFYNLGLISILADAAIVFFMNGMDSYGIVRNYYLVLIGDSILFYSFAFSIALTFMGFFLYNINSYLSNRIEDIKNFLPNVVASSMTVLFITVIMAVVRYVIRQHSELKKTLAELENANLQIKLASAQLEQMAVLKERNRIAGEVHDTVGHTLTTIIFQIEAAKRIFIKEPEKAIEKLNLALMQVRMGLDEIMKSVRSISAQKNKEEFKKNIRKFITETETYTGTSIKYNLSDLELIPLDIQEIVFRALKEGVTNGLRHGGSSRFELDIKACEGRVRFSLQDNGRGCSHIVYGCGLTTMNKRVESTGGRLSVASWAGKGCHLEIEIPI